MDKLELIFPYIMTTVSFIIVTVIVFRWFNFILQKRMLQSGPPDENAIKFLEAGAVQGQSRQWALLLFFGGLGLVADQFLPFSMADSPLPYGVEAIFLAAGFYFNYLLSRKN